MSFFDRQGISQDLLRTETGKRFNNLENPDGKNNERLEDDCGSETSGSETSNTDDFEDDISMLRNYSFISVNIDKTTFGMHRLVQLATRKWLEAHEHLERWKRQYIQNLCAEFPPGNYENWTKYAALFPHVQLVLAQRPEGDDSLKAWALLLHNPAYYANSRGSYSDAERMLLKSIQVRKNVLGQEHQGTLNSLGNLGLIYWHQGRLKEADELHVQVIETKKRVLGQEHPNTLVSINNLGSIYWAQGRLKEAEELEVQVMEIRKRVLGQEHPDTLRGMNTLAWTWKSQNRDAEALDLMSSCLELSTRKLGLNHPDTLDYTDIYNTWKME
jgi:tetratricopeptide (TPR) repeat protein